MALDNNEFDRIYKQYQNVVRGVVIEFENDADDVDDLIQEVFLEAWRSREKYRGDAAMPTWLTAIAKHVCKNHVRDRMRRLRPVLESEIAHDDGDDSDGGWLTNNLLDYDDPESILIAEETAGRIDDVAERLVGRELEVYRLAYLEDMPTADIAAQLGITASTVRVTLHHITKKLSDAV